MYLNQFKLCVSYLAVLSNIFQFLSGMLVCKQYVNNGTTGEATPLPFILGVLSCNLWLLYGIVKPDQTIMCVNIIGITLMVCYVIVFYIYTFKKTVLFRQILATAGTALFVVLYFYMEKDNELLIHRLGLLACSFTLLMVGAPMTKLYYVIKNKCTECLPYPLIICSLFVSFFWFLYGVIVEDLFIMAPNLIGGLLATVQLAVFVIIPSKSYNRLPNKSMAA